MAYRTAHLPVSLAQGSMSRASSLDTGSPADDTSPWPDLAEMKAPLAAVQAPHLEWPMIMTAREPRFAMAYSMEPRELSSMTLPATLRMTDASLIRACRSLVIWRHGWRQLSCTCMQMRRGPGSEEHSASACNCVQHGACSPVILHITGSSVQNCIA